MLEQFGKPEEATNGGGNDRAQPIHNTESGKSSWLLFLSAGLPQVCFADASIRVQQSTENPAGINNRYQVFSRPRSIAAAAVAVPLCAELPLLAVLVVSPAKDSNLVGGREAKDQVGAASAQSAS